MKPFLLIWNVGLVAQPSFVEFLNGRPEFQNWYSPFLGSALVITDASQTASSLSHLVHNQFPSLQLAVLPIETPASVNGWMPQVFWDLIREPKPSGRWPTSNTLGQILGFYGKQSDPSTKTIGEILSGLYGKQADPSTKTLGEILTDLAKKK